MRKDSYLLRSKKLTAIVGILAGVLTSFPAWGAERIQFFVGPFEPTIYVEDLETFAETGEVVDRFSLVGDRLNDDQKSALQDFLNARYDLDAVSTAQFAYSSVGERLLRNAGEIVQTENFLNGMKAMRAGFIFAAAEAEEAGESGYSPLDVIRHFPLETIQLNVPLTREIIAENETIFRQRDRIAAEIRQIADAKAAVTSIPLGDDPKDPGAYSWRIETIEFQNPNRPDPSIADIYYPDAADAVPNSIPVVVISHGFASNRETFTYLAEHWASHGYAVIALEHVETNRESVELFLEGLQGAPDPRHLLQRPQDITAVLDSLASYQGASESLNRLNLDAVGLFGQSLGGYTVLASAGAAINRPKVSEYCTSDTQERLRLNLSTLVQCRLLEIPADTSLSVADPRISAVIAVNPLTSQIFGESGLQQIEVPVMLVAGTRDNFVPALPEQIEPFSWLTTENKNLVLIEPGTHFSALGAARDGVLPVPRGLIGADPTQAFPQIQALSLSFFNRHLKDEAEAEGFLSQVYLNEFPEGDFQFSVVDDYAIASPEPEPSEPEPSEP